MEIVPKKLHAPTFISPQIFNALPLDGVVVDGKIRVCDHEFRFAESPYPDNTVVRVFCGRYYFYCNSLREIEMFKEYKRKEAENRQKAQERVLANQQKEALAFNKGLNVPVSWIPCVKPVYSGLTRHSNGAGCRKNTVYHILLMENLQDGRLKREAMQPLCSKNMGSFSGLIVPDKEPIHAVTCRACLKIAQRWQQG